MAIMHRANTQRVSMRPRTALSVCVFTLATALAACAPTQPSEAGQTENVEFGDTLTMRYLGAAGWEISAPREGSADPVVVLVDPYLTRANYSGQPSADPGDTRPIYSRNDTLFSNVAAIDEIIERADYILVQHSHPDHVMDVPYLALKTGAVVIGHESTINIMRAYGIPAQQLITVRGGEDYDFGDVSIRAIPSLHSPLNDKRYYQSAVVERGATRPLRINQLVEGGSLMFLIRIGGHEVMTMGSMNYIEREVEGLRPDIALVGAAPSHLEIYQYTPKLMAALGYPSVVIPTHADNFRVPYGAATAYREEWVSSFADEIRAAAPDARVIIPRHLEPIRLSVR